MKTRFFAMLCTHSGSLSLFIRAGNFWYVSDQLGEEAGFLRAKVGEADQLLPPVKGWEFYGGGKWDSDPTLECSRELSPACREITVELTGAALKRFPMLAGRYLPVEGKIIRGRPVGSFEKHLNNDLVVGSQFAIGFIINVMKPIPTSSSSAMSLFFLSLQ